MLECLKKMLGWATICNHATRMDLAAFETQKWGDLYKGKILCEFKETFENGLAELRWSIRVVCQTLWSVRLHLSEMFTSFSLICVFVFWLWGPCTLQACILLVPLSGSVMTWVVIIIGRKKEGYPVLLWVSVKGWAYGSSSLWTCVALHFGPR